MRRAVVGVLALILGASAAPSPAASAAEDLAAIACRVDRDVLLRTYRGVMLGRSGDIQMIPTFPNYVAGGLTHSTPFDHTQKVPLLIYGPGYVRTGRFQQVATLADVAPTQGELLDFPFHAPDGEPLDQALLPKGERRLPKLVVTLIWDSGGTELLETWPDAWPYLRQLTEEGAWFPRAEVGASPSNTPTGHAAIGTGSFPDHNGMVDEYFRLGNSILKPNANGPGFMVAPTLADLYDVAMGNEPLVGTAASLSAHVMMMSHGSFFAGGDRDIAITREKEDAETGGDDSAVSWNLTRTMSPYYRLPRYVNRLPGIKIYADKLDRADGALDGAWGEHDLSQFRGGWDSPARTPFQTQLMLEMIRREGFGADDVPDLLFLNYKAIDVLGHAFSADGPEMADALEIQDQHLRVLVRFLNREVGAGEWVMFLTADHGTQRDPTKSGAFLINTGRLQAAITARFDDGDDRPLLQRMRTTEMWLDPVELAENGHTLEEVSGFVLNITKGETVGSQTITPGEADDTVFDAVLPSDMLRSLPCLDEARE
jgi:hypothetical protein